VPSDATGSSPELYDRNYPTCLETYATFRVYSPSMSPEAISAKLGLKPSETMSKGHIRRTRRGGEIETKINGWFLRSKESIGSRDLRHHLDWLLDRLTGVRHSLLALQAGDAEMDVFCYWVSAYGHGGPTLEPEHMRRLADLNLELGLDVYFADEEETRGQVHHVNFPR
jgi:hypothetical protein